MAVKGGNCDEFVTVVAFRGFSASGDCYSWKVEHPLVEYMPDEVVDEGLDRSLRDLLVECFANTPIFRERRFCHEPPAHRWWIRGQNREVVAHVAVHEKSVHTGEGPMAIGGVAEVCVHPLYRGRGYVRTLLVEAHALLRFRDIPFAVLFGHPRIYASSGYVSITNLCRDFPEETGGIIRRPADWAMVLAVGDRHWPEEEVYLPGPAF